MPQYAPMHMRTACKASLYNKGAREDVFLCQLSAVVQLSKLL